MLEFWPIVLTVSGLATSGLFARAVRGHFTSEKLPPAMKFLVALSYLGAYSFTCWRCGPASLRCGKESSALALQIAAAGLFNWARTTT